MNAVIYARYSSDSQREESIESQLRECREYAELSEKIHRGQKENALKGKNNGGGVPIGYLLDKKTQKLVIDPAMAKAKEDYLLTTKLFCGKCERMMVGESGKSHTGAMHYYYKCSGAKRLKDCDKKAVRKDWMERVVVRLTMQRVMDEEKINRLIDAILVMQEQEDTTTPALRSQLAETESTIGNILKAIEQGIFTPSTKQRLDELQKPKLTREQMTAWFEQFRHGDPANREFQKRLIDTFVNAVYVFDDKLVLTYNYQHGTQTISLDEIESALSSDFDGATPPKTKILLIFFLLPSLSYSITNPYTMSFSPEI